MSAGRTPPAGRPDSGEPPGLRDQLGSTIEAGKRLLRAHVDLAKAEIGEIVDEVTRMVALVGAAIGLLVIAGLLLFVGGILFLGEWLFGSIGWGVLLGTLLLIDVALVAILAAFDVSGSRIGSSFIVAVVVGIVVGVVFGLDLPHRGWQAFGEVAAPTIAPIERTVNLAVGVSAAVIGALAFLVGIQGGLRRGIGGLIVGGIVGALIGWFTSGAVAVQVGAALGTFVALVAWPILAGRDIMRTGIDGEALARKFTPEQTIGLTKETIEWVRARTPLVPKS